MHKLYYFPKRDDSVKFIVLDWLNNKYRLLDMKNRQTTMGSFPTVLSFFKSNTELIV